MVKKRTLEQRKRRRETRLQRIAKEPHLLWYKRREWKALRELRLQEEPICRMCHEQGKIVAASVVDHIAPHKGDWDRFIDFDNTQSLCKPHHDASKKREEEHGFSQAIGPDGWPTDPRHPANAP